MLRSWLITGSLIHDGFFMVGSLLLKTRTSYNLQLVECEQSHQLAGYIMLYLVNQPLIMNLAGHIAFIIHTLGIPSMNLAGHIDL